jgi:LacI family trehalose operon transcriptional repressor
VRHGYLALGASKYLQEHRIDDLQVASVGSTPLMKFLHPEIITVDPGYAESEDRLQPS